MNAAMLCYLVLSPEYRETEPVLDYGEGPSYDVRDHLLVWARTAKRAKVTALRVWRRRFRGKWHRPDYLYPGENPWKGMCAERFDPKAEAPDEGEEDRP